MGKKIHFLLIDSNIRSLEAYSRVLVTAGFQISTAVSPIDGLKKTIKLKPDYILADEFAYLDPFNLCQKIRVAKINQPQIFILFEEKPKDFINLVVDGYFLKQKNHQSFLSKLIQQIEGNFILEFWGCRGTLPVPGKDSLRYGGNTNCVTVKIGSKHFFIFDAGTGLKALSKALTNENIFPISADIFITHPHYDHINGIPFFAPFYVAGNAFRFYGTDQKSMTLQKVIAKQMDSVYFPISIKTFAADIDYHSLKEESFYLDEVLIKTHYLRHPGLCLGFRIEYNGKSFCYITDNELYLKSSPHYEATEVERLVKFIKDCDILIMDTTYSDEVYSRKENWGHSCLSRAVDVADLANVKLFCLYHHDHDETDKDIDLKVKKAYKILKFRHSKTSCIAPFEGLKIIL